MKVLFVVTGVGLGDSVRIHTVIKALKKDNPKAQIMLAAYDNSYDYFKDLYPTINIKGYKIPGKSMKFRVLPFIVRNFLLPFVWFFTAFKIKRATKKFAPDIVVSEFEPTGALLAKLVKKKCVMMFGHDPLLYSKFKIDKKVGPIMALQAKYLEKIYDQGDFVIIPTLLGVKRRSLLYTYVNPISRMVPKDLPPKKVLMKKLGFKKEPVLVMLGGSDFGRKLLSQLIKVAKSFPDEKFVVFGSKKLAVPTPNVSHYTFKENVLEYFKIAKGVITLGGSVSLSEAVTFRKPLLIYPIKDHIEQNLNAYSLTKVAMTGHIKNLEGDVRKFLNNISRLQKKMNKIKVKSDGAQEVVTVLKTLLGR